MGSPLAPIPYDVVLGQIVPHLNVQDLSRFMRTSRDNCAYFLRDEVWHHVRARCLAVAPFLQELLFDAFPWKNDEYDDEGGARKKARLRKSQKRAFKLPRGGVWYVLRTYIAKARSAHAMRRFLRYKRDSSRIWIFAHHLCFSIFQGEILVEGRPLRQVSPYHAYRHICAGIAVTAFAFLLQSADSADIQWIHGTVQCTLVMTV